MKLYWGPGTAITVVAAGRSRKRPTALLDGSNADVFRYPAVVTRMIDAVTLEVEVPYKVWATEPQVPLNSPPKIPKRKSSSTRMYRSMYRVLP
jgi:hypothetical protein